MFDIGFFELLLIGVVGLVVIGPKRLPETIRFVGLWVGRIKRSLGAARQEFEKEFGVDEVRRQLHNEDVLRSLGESKEAIQNLSKPVSSLGDESESPTNAATPTTDPDKQPSDGKPDV